MNYLNFRNRFIEFGAFSTYQVRAVFPNFSPNNLTRWQKEGLIVKLRQGFYVFHESVLQPNFTFFLSNILIFLQRSGLRVETRDKQNDKLKAFRIWQMECIF